MIHVVFYMFIAYYSLSCFDIIHSVPEANIEQITDEIKYDMRIFDNIQIDEANNYAYFNYNISYIKHEVNKYNPNNEPMNDLNVSFSYDMFNMHKLNAYKYFYTDDNIRKHINLIYFTKIKLPISKHFDFNSKLIEIYEPYDYTPSISYVSDISYFNKLYNYLITVVLMYFAFNMIMTASIVLSSSQDNILQKSLISTKEFTIITNETTRFSDVIGLEPVKEDIREYANIFRNREQYLDHGCELPKGLIFSGKPGTGKTLLGKALAGESNVTFIYACGSDFIEMFVGVGSSRIRNLFKTAREHAPSVIFIDELDSIGKSRNSRYAGHSESDSTLNSLLAEMDGMKPNENILVIAATNLIGTLDPALTRSGRFDKKIIFDIPNKKERIELFNLYMGKIKLDKGIHENKDESLNKLATMTAGLTGADIKAICNNAIMEYIKTKSILDTHTGTTFKQLENSIADVSIGMVKRERTMTDREKIIVSYHEAGHTMVSYILKQCNPPVKTSIIPRGEATLGYSQQEPTDKKLYTRDELVANICVLLGGRMAESLHFDSVTTGASDDIEKLTKIAYSLVMNYGMSECYSEFDLSYGDTYYKKGLNATTQATIDNIVHNIINYCNGVVHDILMDHEEKLIKLADHLLDNEEVTKYELDELFNDDNDNIENSVDITELLKNNINLNPFGQQHASQSNVLSLDN